MEEYTKEEVKEKLRALPIDKLLNVLLWYYFKNYKYCKFCDDLEQGMMANPAYIRAKSFKR